MADMNISVAVGANTKSFSTGMANVSQGLRMAGGNMGKLASLGAASMATLGVAAAAAGVAITAAFAVKSVKAFIEFEDQIIRTKAILGDRGLGGEAERLEANIREIGRTTRFTAGQVAEAAQQFALAGISVSEMVDDKALEGLVQLSIAAGTDVKTAAGIAIASVKGFRLEMSDMGRVNDVLVKTFTSTNTTIETLGESLKMAAPTAAAAGLSIEEVSAAVGALGNAGIQGTMAGTGLRMAINKLLRPSADARKAMAKLSLDGILTLQPAGMAAQQTIKTLTMEIDSSKKQVEETTGALKTLTAEMNGMSMEQQKNNLDIMKIRRKAEKEGRALTAAEEASITRIESANKDLAIGMAEASLEQSKLKTEQMQAQDSLAAQETQFESLNTIVQESTMGITSLSDMLRILGESGASTAQILEIFGVRGGGAINALLGQAEGFDNLVQSINNAGGATDDFSKVLKTSAQQQVFELQSAFSDLMLSVGEELTPVVVELMQIFKDDVIPIIMDMMPLFKALAVLLKVVGVMFKFILFFMQPLFNIIIAIDEVITALFEGRWVDALGGVVKLFANLALFLTPFLRVAYAIAKIAMSFDLVSDAVAWLGKKMNSIPLLGDVIGFVGDALSFIGLADGGVITQPTQALIGEGGEAEVVAPISKLTEVVGTGGAQALVNALPGPNITVPGVTSQAAAGSSNNTSGGGSSDVTNNKNIDINIGTIAIQVPAGMITPMTGRGGVSIDEKGLGEAIGKMLLSNMGSGFVRGI